jgi:hypothetical protein
MPGDAAIVKTHWQRSDFGDGIAVYDTSAARLRSRLAGAADWGPGDGQAHPSADDIYTVRIPGGAEYRMTAMHIMTKELRHWVWITLWWSPDGAADQDFGADRPAAISALGGPWGHYKMCVVTAFREDDADPTGGYGETAPSLAEALAAVHAGQGGPSWCSNPYLELGEDNARSNCIGCHQHAGTGTNVVELVDDLVKQRDNFPADYLWSMDTGDDRAGMFQAEVDASGG